MSIKHYYEGAGIKDFSKLQRITDFQIVSEDYGIGEPLTAQEAEDGMTSINEIADGTIRIPDGKICYFKWNHEFDEGNTYIVFDANNQPFGYFFLYLNEETDIFNKLTPN